MIEIIKIEQQLSKKIENLKSKRDKDKRKDRPI